MNKNNKSMRLMAAAMVTVITAGMAGTCNYQRNVITAKAADVKELQKVAETALETDSVEAEETEETEEASEEEKEQGAKKEESVYVKADPAGNVKDTTVTEWIKNPGNGKLSDVSELDGIENIKGEESYQVSADAGLDWKAEGNDIYYQGTTKKELPVGVKISYKLDGENISAEDLKGKDGRVEIHIQYSNSSKTAVDVAGEKEEMFTPFTMITAMMLPADEYQNVEIDNGKVLSDADKQIVVGLGFPGISENLKLTDGDFDFDLPEEVTITAEVKNASVGPTITAASTDFLQNLDFDDMDGFDDLNDSIAELEDATNQLVDGSREAADGAGELAGGAGTLAGGTGTLKNGIDTLNSKSGELIAGVETLSNGITTYTQGIQNLADAMNNNQMADASAQVAAGAQGVKTGVTAVETYLIATGAISRPVATTSQMSSEAASISNSLAGLQNTVENISAQAQVVNNGGGEVQCDIAGLEAYLGTLGIENPGEAAGQIRSYFTSSEVTTAATAEVSGEKAQALAEIQSIQSMAENLQADASAAVNQTRAVNDQMQMVFYGNGTMENPGLVNASNAVADGAGKLSVGIKQISEGVNALQAHNDELSGGAAKLLQGGSQLAAGVSQLAAGADTLNSGAGTLADGANALADGNRTLADGMAEYKTEAIDKLTGLFGGDISKAKDRLKAMADLGKDYKSFAGISSEMNGSTKFIIETEGVNE
ncbi:MAG: hypothetical protein HFH10_00810 [Dorea sp.]|nr:hypothetical protein [Dorea sp.]